MALAEAIFIGQFCVFITLLFIYMHKLIDVNDKKSDSELSWSFIFTNAALVLTCFMIGLQINLLELDLIISALYNVQGWLFRIFIPLFMVSIFMMFTSIPDSLPKSYTPNKR